MPTYQYACTVCGHRLEAVQSFSDDPLSVCPECAGKLRKVFSAVGVVFKGSGFYRTDSRAGNGSNGTKSGEAAKSDSASSGTKAETSSASSGNGKSGNGSSGGSGSSKSAAPAST